MQIEVVCLPIVTQKQLCWAKVGIWLYGWPIVGVGSTTLAQHCPYVNILSLAVGWMSSWNQYVGPTLGQCTTMTCINMTEMRWVHYIGPTLDQHWTNIRVQYCFWMNTTLTQRRANVRRRPILT